ncbi:MULTISPECIES: urea amidolyase family protein [Tsukamurella]|uniref:5-oxoprolinase/urea amidolyase family protein n=2 Tax=Tsukamurella TaxID=2060 RepID=A0A5C5S0Z3_9ACTN|nr:MULTISPECIES: urea amidolyase family protein [Tsukamurella]NMD54128.1 5-oxoprolinase/urea amidolyase family protein [Tsukamurella columbiensis]TWS28338.1 5-oxoprolinase/urea amidolyase family protein [Tsukamurella conjunctivitidis]
MSRTDVRRLGARAVRVRVVPGAVEALRARLAAEPLPGQRELVPGGETITVLFDGARSAGEAERILSAMEPPEPRVADGPLVEIGVVYDGEDLRDVAELLGTDPAGVVRMHTERSWHVGFLGFAPGFAYLRSAEPGPEIARRSSPRVRVPAGSVGLAGEYSAVYPRTSPGGWQLIGRTEAELWSLDRDPPALLVPGARVRFTAVRERIVVPEAPAPPDPGPAPTSGLLVRATGLQSLVEDLGRPGLAAIGVTRSGAADRAALRQANRLVGNPEHAAGIENVGGGVELVAVGEQVVAVSGADAELVVEAPDGHWRTVERGRPFALDDGDLLEIGPVTAGLRVVIAVRGGIDVPPVLGSRSTDTLAHLGPGPITAGAVLPVGRAPRTAVGVPETVPAVPDGSRPTVLGVTPGPDAGLFPDGAWEHLLDEEWEVTPQSDRVGVRLTGRPLERFGGEVQSQALVPGAIQVPPSGHPVVFVVDHPTTGGYPVLAVVAEEYLDRLAQLPLGSMVSFADGR